MVDSVNPSDIRVTVVGDTVRFTIRGTDEFTYRATASSQPDTYELEGVLNVERVRYDVIGDSSITVSAAPPPRPSRPRAPASRNRAPSFEEGSSATRSISENSVAGTAVGDPIAATDRDDDDIAYSLVSGDTSCLTSTSRPANCRWLRAQTSTSSPRAPTPSAREPWTTAGGSTTLPSASGSPTWTKRG